MNEQKIEYVTLKGKHMGTKAKVEPTGPAKYEDLKQVKFAHSEEEVAVYLSQGFKIFHMGAQHLDTNGYNCKPLIIMGRD